MWKVSPNAQRVRRFLRCARPLSAALALAAFALGCGGEDATWVWDHAARPRTVVTHYVGGRVDGWALLDIEGTTHSIAACRGRIVVLEFWSCRCPYVEKSEAARQRLVATYAPRGVVYLAVDSNRDEYPEEIKQYLAERGSSYTVLADYGSNGAAEFNATRTPLALVIDREGVVRFMGSPLSPEQFARGEAERADWLEAALDALLARRLPDPPTRPLTGSRIRRYRIPF